MEIGKYQILGFLLKELNLYAQMLVLFYTCHHKLEKEAMIKKQIIGQ